jgi:hypothetical protein
VNGITGNYLPAAMRASDADRDAVLSDLSGHFQAGRLTVAELDERTGRALAARTWGELGDLMADLPADRPASPALAQAAARASSAVRPEPSRHPAPPLLASLAGIAVTVVVLVTVIHAGWGLIWPLLAVLLIARAMMRRAGTSRHWAEHN